MDCANTGTHTAGVRSQTSARVKWSRKTKNCQAIREPGPSECAFQGM